MGNDTRHQFWNPRSVSSGHRWYVTSTNEALSQELSTLPDASTPHEFLSFQSLRIIGEFIAIKRQGQSKVAVYSAFAPNSMPLIIDSAHIASSGCHLLLQTVPSRWQTADSATEDDSTSPHLFAPSSHGIVIFNLLLAFGCAGADSATSLSTPPVVVNLQPTGAPSYQCQHLAATDDGKLLACAQKSGVSVLALRDLKVSSRRGWGVGGAVPRSIMLPLHPSNSIYSASATILDSHRSIGAFAGTGNPASWRHCPCHPQQRSWQSHSRCI